MLDQPGVRAVIVLEGINDIGYSQDADLGCLAPTTNVSAAQIIGGYQKMIAMAHAHGDQDHRRHADPVRELLVLDGRGPGQVDGGEPLDPDQRGVRRRGRLRPRAGVPGHPNDVNPRYDSGDGLHPSDAGYQAMADAINLSQLR